MKNSDKDHQEFEKSWKDAFEGAEMMPSEDIWEKIDGALANQDSYKFKRKIAFYKYAAVISLLILLGGGVLTYQYVNENMIFKSEASDPPETQNDLLTTKENTEETGGFRNETNKVENSVAGSKNNNLEDKTSKETFDNSIASARDEELKKENLKINKGLGKALAGKSSTEGENGINNSKLSISSAGIDQPQNNLVISTPDVAVPELQNNEKLNTELLNELFSQQIFETSINRQLADLAFAPKKGFENLEVSTEKAQKEVYRVPDYRLALSKKKNESNEFFAGLSFTPNFFDPNIQMNSGNMEAATLSQNSLAMGVNPGNQEQNIQPQMSYAYGVNFGLKLSKKWIVHSGLQYAKNNTVSSTHSFLQPDFNSDVRYAATPVTLNKLSNEGLSPDKLGFTQPVSQMIELNNNFEFASIPIKAGYIIIDKKLMWVISTGVGTDIFLNNRIEDQHSQFEIVTIRPGESSPYRNLFFNGLASSEIIYNFAKNYSFSLEPSLRIALNSFSKSDSYITSLPHSFGVAAGLRYHFRK